MLQEVAGGLQSLCWCTRYAGAILTSWVGGSIVQVHGPRAAYALSCVFPLSVAAAATLLQVLIMTRRRMNCHTNYETCQLLTVSYLQCPCSPVQAITAGRAQWWSLAQRSKPGTAAEQAVQGAVVGAHAACRAAPHWLFGADRLPAFGRRGHVFLSHRPLAFFSRVFGSHAGLTRRDTDSTNNNCLLCIDEDVVH